MTGTSDFTFFHQSGDRDFGFLILYLKYKL